MEWEIAGKKLLAATRCCSCPSPGQGTSRLIFPGPSAEEGVRALRGFIPVCRLEIVVLGLSVIQASQNPVISGTEIPLCSSQVLRARKGCL